MRVLFVSAAFACQMAAPTAALAQDSARAIPSFVATCRDIQTHGLRIDTDPMGKPLPETWGEEGRFLSEIFERFSYVAGRDVLLLEQSGRQVPVVAATRNALLAIDTSASGDTISSWSYLIHFERKHIVATQVNGYDVFGSGVKSRHVRLSCRFESR